jgi:hypothetical protein
MASPEVDPERGAGIEVAAKAQRRVGRHGRSPLRAILIPFACKAPWKGLCSFVNRTT